MAGQLGFKPNSNALEYGGGDPFANNKNRNYADRRIGNQRGLGNSNYAEARGLGMPEEEHLDDARRGHYIPSNARAENQFVRVTQPELQPTQPDYGASRIAKGGRQQEAQERPRAIAMGQGPVTRS